MNNYYQTLIKFVNKDDIEKEDNFKKWSMQ